MTTVEDVVGAYIRLRDEKAQNNAEVKAKNAIIEAKLAQLEAWLKVEADKQKVTSFKTKSGTAFLTTKDFASVENWDTFIAHVEKEKAFDMLDKRVNKTAVKAYIDVHKQVPPGVNYGTMLDINIRKPTASAD